LPSARVSHCITRRRDPPRPPGELVLGAVDAVPSRAVTDEKLWRYSRLSRIWSRTLVVVGVLVFAVGLAMQIGESGHAFVSWLVTAVATLIASTLVFFFLLRGWMSNGGLPSARLADATPEPRRPRRMEATSRNWSSWTWMLGGALFLSSVLIMGFLIGVLGGGGVAEGVVAGVLIAWGVVTASDVIRLERIEAEQRRIYFAACKRPVSVGSVLIWRTDDGPGRA
jgi:NhaP-type Na+/H+ or K+/H+ antiporter